MKIALTASIWVVALAALAGSFFLYREVQAPVSPMASTTSATSTENEEGEAPLVSSGVEGRVLIGPTCPVERVPPDPNCADRPYATAITVYRSGVKIPFIIGNSSAAGTFTFSLPPGSYTLVAGSGGTLPRCGEVTAAVVPDEYTVADISCDSGIR